MLPSLSGLACRPCAPTGGTVRLGDRRDLILAQLNAGILNRFNGTNPNPNTVQVGDELVECIDVLDTETNEAGQPISEGIDIVSDDPVGDGGYCFCDNPTHSHIFSNATYIGIVNNLPQGQLVPMCPVCRDHRLYIPGTYFGNAGGAGSPPRPPRDPGQGPAPNAPIRPSAFTRPRPGATPRSLLEILNNA